MSGRKHHHNHFYKYASYKTALRVIESKSFRWSSPTKFNDPFDHQVGFVLDFSPDELAHFLIASIDRIIFSEVAPVVIANPLFAALMQLRSIRDTLSRSQLIQEMRKASIASAAQLHRNIGQLNGALQEHLCHSRVFCVSETHDNIVMWSHYSDNHKGVVFKLRCIDEIDNTLLAARKVDYRDTLLPFLSAGQYARHLTGEEAIDMTPLFWNIAYAKHKDWSYEKEWRVHISLMEEPPGDGYSVYSEDPRVFEAIYLGCRMSGEEITEITTLVKKYLPDTRIFLGHKNSDSFSLSFTETE